MVMMKNWICHLYSRVCAVITAAIDKRNKAFIISLICSVQFTSYGLSFPFHREDSSEFRSNIYTSYKIWAYDIFN